MRLEGLMGGWLNEDGDEVGWMDGWIVTMVTALTER